MDFRKELAKELGLGAIAENTMLNDYVKACEVIAIRYHKSKVKKLNIPDVVERSEQLPKNNRCIANPDEICDCDTVCINVRS